MSNTPLVSIILPTYNQAKYLPAAINGVFNQSFQNFELIIVNDGSTDETIDLLKEFKKYREFKIVNQKNLGLPRALNNGISEASGKYLTWTSSDNIMMSSMLDTLVKHIEEDNTVGVVYADWYFIDELDTILSLYQTLNYDRHILLRHNFVHCCFLFLRECIDAVGVYNPDFIYNEDWEFWIRVSRSYKMKHIPRALYLYRVHSESMTSEIQNNTSTHKKRYEKFESYLRKKYILDWYYSKVKWQLLRLRLGYDPREKWLKAINCKS